MTNQSYTQNDSKKMAEPMTKEEAAARFQLIDETVGALTPAEKQLLSPLLRALGDFYVQSFDEINDQQA
jgi:DNA replication initiation complex subunit (GINS family)